MKYKIHWQRNFLDFKNIYPFIKLHLLLLEISTSISRILN